MKIVIATDPHQPNDKYRDALLCAGALPEEVEIVTPADPLPAEFDGLLLAGGADVDPQRYGESVLNGTVEIHHDRDRLDFALIEQAESRHVPVFGICRGLQVLNVAAGGTLWQDVPAQRDRGVKHDCYREDGFVPGHEAHAVRFSPGLKLSTVALARAQQVPQPLTVNSRHHQAIKDLAPGLVPVAASPDDLVEAFEDRARPWMAVQWHPEDLVSHPAHKELFSGFVESCRASFHAAGQPDLPLVEVSLAGEIPVLRLNRPDHDNMLAGRLGLLLADSLEALLSDPTVPALVLTGSGRSFCRGTDPRYLSALLRCSDEAGYIEFLDTQARSILAVAGGTRPVLAALDGPAAGFGLSLALASDVRIVASRGREPVAFSPSASPGVPDLGSGATFLLPVRAGFGASSDFFFSGESLSIGRARELRLIDYWVEDGPARPFALARATAYSGQLPSVISSLKSLLSTRTRPELLATLAREKEVQLSMFRSGELRKALPVPNRRPAKEPLIQ